MRRTPLLARRLVPVSRARWSGCTPPRTPARRAVATGGLGHDTVRFSTFNASLNRSNAGDLVRDLSTPDNAQAKNVAETIQRVSPDVLLVNEFDYAPAAVDLFRDNYLEVSQNGAAPVDLPLRLHRAVEHRRAQRLRPQQQRHGRRPRRRVRLRPLRGPVRHGRATRSTRSTPAGVRTFQHFLLEGHARGDAAGRPGHSRAGRLVLPRGARGAAAVVEVALGPADPDRPEDRALPGLAPDTAGLRRPRGPQRHAQLRRDPLLGRLRAPLGERLHLRRRRAARRPAARARRS